MKVVNGEFTRQDDVTLKECTDIGEVATVLARVYAFGDFRTNTPIGCMEQQETKNPDMAQLALECGEFLFITEANIVCAKVIGILLGNTLHFRRVDCRKGGGIANVT